jgi:hypothetical protein
LLSRRYHVAVCGSKSPIVLGNTGMAAAENSDVLFAGSVAVTVMTPAPLGGFAPVKVNDARPVESVVTEPR